MSESVKLAPRTALGGPFGVASPILDLRSETVSLVERADLGSVLLSTAIDMDSGTREALGKAGVQVPEQSGAVTRHRSGTAIWLSPRSWLIQCPAIEGADLARSISSLAPSKLLHAVCFTDALCWIELSGSGAADLLSEGGFLSLERGGIQVGFAKRTLIAQINVIVVRESLTMWLLGVERSRASYFLEWLCVVSGAAVNQRSEWRPNSSTAARST